MRAIDMIVIHCSATPEGRAVTAADIDHMHRQRGFARIGYHYFIRLDGTLELGRPLEVAGAHVEGHNARSIGICYAGGLDAYGKAKDTRTTAQKVALAHLVRDLRKRFPAARRVVGHRDLSPDRDRDGKVEPHEWLKDCPCFDVAAWLKSEGIA
jgi:N-acetylmuramoyl-L-alanine amidase